MNASITHGGHVTTHSAVGLLAALYDIHGNLPALEAVLDILSTPRSDEEIVTAATPDAEAFAMLADTEESLVVCGHTHVQFRRQVDGWELVNAGSVGMSTVAAEAQWLLAPRHQDT